MALWNQLITNEMKMCGLFCLFTFFDVQACDVVIVTVVIIFVVVVVVVVGSLSICLNMFRASVWCRVLYTLWPFIVQTENVQWIVRCTQQKHISTSAAIQVNISDSGVECVKHRRRKMKSGELYIIENWLWRSPPYDLRYSMRYPNVCPMCFIVWMWESTFWKRETKRNVCATLPMIARWNIKCFYSRIKSNFTSIYYTTRFLHTIHFIIYIYTGKTYEWLRCIRCSSPACALLTAKYIYKWR